MIVNKQITLPSGDLIPARLDDPVWGSPHRIDYAFTAAAGESGEVEVYGSWDGMLEPRILGKYVINPAGDFGNIHRHDGVLDTMSAVLVSGDLTQLKILIKAYYF